MKIWRWQLYWLDNTNDLFCYQKSKFIYVRVWNYLIWFLACFDDFRATLDRDDFLFDDWLTILLHCWFLSGLFILIFLLFCQLHCSLLELLLAFIYKGFFVFFLIVIEGLHFVHTIFYVLLSLKGFFFFKLLTLIAPKAYILWGLALFKFAVVIEPIKFRLALGLHQLFVTPQFHIVKVIDFVSQVRCLLEKLFVAFQALWFWLLKRCLIDFRHTSFFIF